MGGSPPEQLQAPLIAPAPDEDDHEGQLQLQPWWSCLRTTCSCLGTICFYVLSVAFFALLTLIFLTPFVYLINRAITQANSTGVLEYSVAITGADGLLADGGNPRLSPVFNLTIRIKQFDISKAMVYMGGRSAELTVSYHRALLAKDPAWPGFCVKYMEEREVEATVWGIDVAVPRFLRERLARELRRDEAVFDVEARDPGSWQEPSFACEPAKIGGDPYPCK